MIKIGGSLAGSEVRVRRETRGEGWWGGGGAEGDRGRETEGEGERGRGRKRDGLYLGVDEGSDATAP